MKKISLTLISLVTVVLFWYILGTGFVLKDNSNTFSKLQCVSYAPFGKDDSPFMMDKGLVISEDLVRKDLQLLSKYTDCIRTYSTVGLEMVPKIARENNLKMLMGAWVNGDEKPTRKEIDTLIKLANENKDIVNAVIVGNEALLRGDLEMAQQKYQEAVHAKLYAEKRANLSESNRFDMNMMMDNLTPDMLKEEFGFNSVEDIEAFKGGVKNEELRNYVYRKTDTRRSKY